jgi:hypothetical protein
MPMAGAVESLRQTAPSQSRPSLTVGLLKRAEVLVGSRRASKGCASTQRHMGLDVSVAAPLEKFQSIRTACFGTAQGQSPFSSI